MQRGQTLLEFAVTIPILIAFTVGAIDVASLLRAQLAVREAAEVAARELSAINGSAQQVSDDTRTKRFSWIRYSWGGNQLTRTDLGVSLVEGQTPAACIGLPPGEYCERQFDGYLGGAPAQRTFLPANAHQAAEAALRSILPVKGLGCTEAQCASVAVTFEGAPSQERSVQVSISYVAEILLFGRSPLTVSGTSSRAIESAFFDGKNTIRATTL